MPNFVYSIQKNNNFNNPLNEIKCCFLNNRITPFYEYK